MTSFWAVQSPKGGVAPAVFVLFALLQSVIRISMLVSFKRLEATRVKTLVQAGLQSEFLTFFTESICAQHHSARGHDAGMLGMDEIRTAPPPTGRIAIRFRSGWRERFVAIWMRHGGRFMIIPLSARIEANSPSMHIYSAFGPKKVSLKAEKTLPT